MYLLVAKFVALGRVLLFLRYLTCVAPTRSLVISGNIIFNKITVVKKFIESLETMLQLLWGALIAYIFI